MNDKKTLVKGILMGFAGGLLIPLLIIIGLVFFNYGDIGRAVETSRILDDYSLKPLSNRQKAEGALAGMVDALEDPYSYYLDEGDYADLQDEVSGDYQGLGVYLVTEKDAEYTEVLSPIKGSPAFEAGMLGGDEIISVNGEDMAGKDAEYISTKIKRGEESHFIVEVRRDGEDILSFEMDRTEIEMPSVEGQWLDEKDGVLYVAITSFTDKTPEEYNQTLADLTADSGIKGLILDLRNNPGGSVAAVLDVAGHFLPEDSIVVWVKDKSGQDAYTSYGCSNYDFPVVVLVNENSASAAEILSCALQDNNAATLVGTTTYGKGVIQTIYPISGGAAVKVTTAEYLSPEEKTIHEVGVEPDMECELEGDDPTAVYSLDRNKDNQLDKAMQLLYRQMANE